MDSTTAWTEAILPWRPVLDGGKPISLFDGYRSVVLLLDVDGPGRRAAAVKQLVKRQAPGTPVRDVVLSDVGDVCEFFDRGRLIDDRVEAIRAGRVRSLEWLGVTDLTEEAILASVPDLAKSREDADRLRSAAKYLLRYTDNYRSNIQLEL